MRAIRYALFACMSWVTVSVYSLLVMLGRIFGPRVSLYFGHQWAILTLWLCEKICGLSYRVEGTENIPDEPCVVFIKHSSVFETLAQLAIFPAQCWVLKRELLWLPFFGWGMKALRPIAINRQSGRAAVEQVIEQGRERFEAGLFVCIFPEGTRMAVGETRRYGMSGTILAQKNGKLILPAAHNAGTFWPRKRFGIDPGEVQFVIGKPLDPAGRDPREMNAEIQDWVEARVAEFDSNSG
ncbi:MAG: lysophospholipid acyltransferase family protein [Gammaproteobacteria bacterium]